MPELKEVLRRIPYLGTALTVIVRKCRAEPPFETSARYWERRYAHGGHSGSGSRSTLAHFKAEIVNDFVSAMKVRDVVELGCGDGRQLSLARYPKYHGYDISPTSVSICRDVFRDDHTKKFSLLDVGELPEKADLVLSLDVIYHLVEDNVYEDYMGKLFSSSRKYVIIYSSNFEHEESDHVRHRNFTKWIYHNEPGFQLIRHIPNRYPYDPLQPSTTSLAEFFVYSNASHTS